MEEHLTMDSSGSYITAAVWVVFSFAFFRLCQFLVSYYIFGELALGEFTLFGWKRGLDNYEDEEEDIPPKTKWRISNEIVSALHAGISGLWAGYALLLNKELVYDMNVTNDVSIYLLFVSAGYLIHDFLDLILNDFSCRVVELLYHHIVVLVAFMIPLYFERYMGIVLLGLLMELNSTMLHCRSLCNLYRVSKQSLLFRVLAMLNLISFVLFRLVVSAYLCYWLIQQLFEERIWVCVIFFFVIGSLTVSNVVLFYRVMLADGFFGKRRSKKKARTPDGVLTISERTTHSNSL